MDSASASIKPSACASLRVSKSSTLLSDGVAGVGVSKFAKRSKRVWGSGSVVIWDKNNAFLLN
jgi:hypothetical protein